MSLSNHAEANVGQHFQQSRPYITQNTNILLETFYAISFSGEFSELIFVDLVETLCLK